MLPRLAIVALFAALTLSACSGNEEEDPGEAQATPEASYPLATIAEPFGLNTEFYNVASEVPGFAGLSVTQTQDALNVYMSDPSTDIETIRAGMIKYMSDAQRFGDWEMHIVPVRYGWRELYDWYQELTIIVSEVDGLIYSDINEGRNLLEFGAVDEEAQEAMEGRIADYDIPEDAVIVEVTGPFIDD